jgi:hypothetical protein
MARPLTRSASCPSGIALLDLALADLTVSGAPADVELAVVPSLPIRCPSGGRSGLSIHGVARELRTFASLSEKRALGSDVDAWSDLLAFWRREHHLLQLEPARGARSRPPFSSIGL